MLTDQFNRVHDYLRISLTDSCNLRCFYCMPDEKVSFMPSLHLMQAEEIATLASIFVDLGVKKIRLTGGEPLVRKDAGNIMRRLSELPVELTLTTNGTRLKQFADDILSSRIRSLNISLDTLDATKFLLMTKRNDFNLVRENIRLMMDLGLFVKVNVVVMKGINENEINDFIAWTKNEAVQIRFIEFMPFTGNKWQSDKLFTAAQILSTIEKEYGFVRASQNANDTAKNYLIEGHRGSFGVISTMTESFCGNCNRMRLTADGKMKNCLFSKNETDLLTPLRNGKNVLPFIRQCILEKAAARGGQFSENFESIDPSQIQNRSMVAIGG